MQIIKAWAPPLGSGWSKWTTIYSHWGQLGTFKATFETESDAPSSFDIEILEGGKTLSKKYVGPYSIKFSSKDCYCKTKVRFKSHFAGQTIRIEVQ